jgi:hypothetical protein
MSAAPQLDGTLISHIVFTLFLSQNSAKQICTPALAIMLVVMFLRQRVEHWGFSRLKETNHLVAAAQAYECQNARGSWNGGF